MKLLIITQKVDKNDPILGFFTRWIEELAKYFENMIVICLEKGPYELPENVRVLSLGKEKNVKHRMFNKFRYLLNFYKYIWQERGNYDVVFVHMNQEYVLLAGDMWRLLGKKILLWRNHPYGDFLTRIAVFLSHKVFYTSPSSYTARFSKSFKMPVGVDADFFKPDPSAERVPNSALVLGRISPIKKILEAIEWIKARSYKATIAGQILDKDYGKKVLDALTPDIKYIGSVDQSGALRLYQSHEIYVNMTPSGSYDKTIFEAALCEMDLVLENPEAKEELSGKKGKELRDYVLENHSLSRLAKMIYEHASH